ncbi:MAG: hypothetical protein K8I60_03140, partial [Anaerolineae bacterium]|nr:hypothetical protein [Anaerolineae bacterium]
TDTVKGIRVKSIYVRLKEEIESKEITKAVEIINSLATDQEKIKILSQLAHNLASDHMLTYAIERSLARDLANTLEQVFARAFARDRDHTNNRDHSLIHALALALALAQALAVALARTYHRTFAKSSLQVLITGLEMLLDLEEKNREKLEIPFRDRNLLGVVLKGKASPRTQFTGLNTLTPASLEFLVVPYIQALIDLEQVISQLTGKPFTPPRIESISQQSPLSIILDVPKAIEVLHEIITPWRHKHTKQLADLEELEKRAAIAKAEAEIQEKRAQAAQTRTDIKATEERQPIELERLRLENEAKRLELEQQRQDMLFHAQKAQLEIHREKLDLALSIVERFAPNLSEKDRLMIVIQMMKSLTVLIENPLELLVDSEHQE